MKLLFHSSYSKNASMMRWRKYGEMVFLVSKNAINTFFWVLVLIVQPGTPWRWSSQVFRPSLPRYIGSSIAKPHKTSSECCTACYKSLLHVLFDVDLTQKVLVRLMSCVTCGASETCGSLSVQIRIYSLVPRPCAFIAGSTKFTQKAWSCSARDMCRSICHNHFTENHDVIGCASVAFYVERGSQWWFAHKLS